jgi:hypothetical protein
MIRILIAAPLGGVALFAWNFLSWSVLDVHAATPGPLPQASAAGIDPMSPVVLLQGLALNLAAALLAAGLLSVSAVRGYLARLLFVALLGLFVALVCDMGYWNSMSFPLDYSLIMGLDRVIGWTCAGVLMAAIVRPPHGR